MLRALLSGDLPRSRWLLGVALVGDPASALPLAPFLFPGAKPLNTAAKICVFIVLVASYDLLLGYTGIVSFAHTMFFGIGGYGVAHRALRLGRDLDRGRWPASPSRSSPASRWPSLIGLFSLRVRAIFFAMITLAVASRLRHPGLAALRHHRRRGRAERSACRRCCGRASRWSTCRCSASPSPAASSPTTSSSSSSLVLFLVLLRIVNSPFGRVLQAIRENDFRAEALGYRTVYYRTLANCLAAGDGGAGRRAATRCGCATPGPTPRSPSPSCSTSC